MGQLGDAAKFIENTLANFVPLLLDFLARLLRLGNVSEKIKKILMRVRKPIDDLLAKIMTFIKNKIKGFGKKGKKKKETKDQTKQDMKKDKGKDGVTDVDRKKHKELLEEIKQELKKPSKAKDFTAFYKEKKVQARKLEKKYNKRLKKKIKTTIRLESLEKAAKENDIDIRIRIAPNTAQTNFDLYFLRDTAKNNIKTLKDEIEKVIDANPTAGLDALKKQVNSVIDMYRGGKREFTKVSKDLTRIYVINEDGNQGRPVKILVGEITPDLKAVPLERRVKILLKKSTHFPASQYSGGKHVKGKTDTQRYENSHEDETRNPEGQFLASIKDADIVILEKEVFMNPDRLVDKGGTIHAYKEYSTHKGFAARKGAKAYIIRAEMTKINYDNPSPVIHSHPRNDMRD